MGSVTQLFPKRNEQLRVGTKTKTKERAALQPMDPQAIAEAMYRPEETGQPDEFSYPLSTCCGYPPLEHVQLCGCCRDHCGWYEGDDER